MISKKTTKIICCLLFLLFMFTGCKLNNEEEQVLINDETYEEADHDWTVYGNYIQDGDYYLYENSSSVVFARKETNMFSEGIIYHNTNDEYPNISMESKIEKIVLDNGIKQITIEDNIADMFVQEFNRTDKTYKSADVSTAELYVNVYYKDYPAYQNEFVLCSSDSNEFGFMYCETEKNTNMFGKNNMALFLNDEIISYIQSLKLLN
ncbi:MAG: hypothetical protein K2K01_05810 [Eubacterium sp.]|nr:hypothetical protein [Eubacterium sp.]